MALNSASCSSSCALPSSIQTKPTFFIHLIRALGPAAIRQGWAPPDRGRGALSCHMGTSMHNGTAEPDVWVQGCKTEGEHMLNLSSAFSLCICNCKIDHGWTDHNSIQLSIPCLVLTKSPFPSLLLGTRGDQHSSIQPSVFLLIKEAEKLINSEQGKADIG